MQMSLTELWGHMGWFARGIVFVLILMSVISLSIAVAKWFRFRKMAATTRAFAPQFSEALEQERIKDALDLTDQYQSSHVARVLGESLREVAPLLEDERVASAAINSAERSIDREQILLANELKGGLGLLATVGATAPCRPAGHHDGDRERLLGHGHHGWRFGSDLRRYRRSADHDGHRADRRDSGGMAVQLLHRPTGYALL